MDNMKLGLLNSLLLSAVLIAPAAVKADDALIEIYRKLRPGDPPTAQGGRAMLEARFFDAKKYDIIRIT